MSKHTLRFIFRNLPWLFVFCALALAGLLFPWAAKFGGSVGGLVICAVVIYGGLVMVVMGAEQHRRALREGLAWQAFMEIVHNRDDNGLPLKHEDMTAIKALEVTVRKRAIPPSRASFEWIPTREVPGMVKVHGIIQMTIKE